MCTWRIQLPLAWWSRAALSVVLLLVSTTGSASAGCVGDCNIDGRVTVDELIRGVNIALGNASSDGCLAFETNGDGKVTIDEILRGVTGTLTGCPDAPTPTPTVSARVEIEPQGVLLTGPGESKALTAVVVMPNGQRIQGEASWVSSDPAIVSVDETGTVRAVATTGTARITATVGNVQSEPAYVYVAAPVAGAALIDDSQIVSGPTIVDPDAEPMFDNPYEVVLRGSPSVAPGTILINTEALPVAGRVVSATPDGNDVRVRLVVVPPDELFTDFEFTDNVDLSQGPFEIPEELVETYDIEQRGNTFVFAPKPTTAAALTSPIAAQQALAPQQGTPMGTIALPPLPPFKECTASAEFGSGLPVPLALSAAPAFELSVNATLEREFTSQSKTIRVRGEPTFKLTSVLEIKSAFEAKVECKVTLVRRKVRVPGFAGLFFGGDVEFGVGFQAGGKVTLVSAKVGGTATLSTTIDAGIVCPSGDDCAVTGNVSADTEAKPTLEAPSLNQAQFEPGVSLFGFVTGELGNADLEQLQFRALEAKAGAELGANLTLEALQMDNTDPDGGRSKYALAFKGEVGPGIKLGEFLAYIGLTEFVPLKLTFEVPLGGSPTGAVTADRASYLPGDPVSLQVKLGPDSTLFPAGGLYNVERVAVLRKSGLLSSEVLAEQTAGNGQTDFAFTFNSPGLVTADELFAFVVTKLLPLDPPKLEIGAATVATQPSGGGQVTFHQHEDFVGVGSLDTMISATLTSANALDCQATGMGMTVADVPSGCNRPPEVKQGEIVACDLSVFATAEDPFAVLRFEFSGTETHTACGHDTIVEPFTGSLFAQLEGTPIFTNGVITAIDFDRTTTNGNQITVTTGIVELGPCTTAGCP